LHEAAPAEVLIEPKGKSTALFAALQPEYPACALGPFRRRGDAQLRGLNPGWQASNIFSGTVTSPDDLPLAESTPAAIPSCPYQQCSDMRQPQLQRTRSRT